jgi:hypothetical protein
MQPSNPTAEHETGTVYQTHPQTRTEALAKCHQRGYHVARRGATVCAECGTSGALVFHDLDGEPESRKPYNAVPPGPLGHNPNATEAELQAARGTPVVELLKGARPAPVHTEPISLTKEDAIAIARAAGATVIDDGDSGHSLHIGDRLKTAEAHAQALQAQLNTAKAFAASALKENGELKAKLAEMEACGVHVSSETASPKACPDCGCAVGHTAGCVSAPWNSEKPNA